MIGSTASWSSSSFRIKRVSQVLSMSVAGSINECCRFYRMNVVFILNECVTFGWGGRCKERVGKKAGNKEEGIEERSCKMFNTSQSTSINTCPGPSNQGSLGSRGGSSTCKRITTIRAFVPRNMNRGIGVISDRKWWQDGRKRKQRQINEISSCLTTSPIHTLIRYIGTSILTPQAWLMLITSKGPFPVSAYAVVHLASSIAGGPSPYSHRRIRLGTARPWKLVVVDRRRSAEVPATAAAEFRLRRRSQDDRQDLGRH
jgi:hypothetical protein